jgi:hypothetical protein
VFVVEPDGPSHPDPHADGRRRKPVAMTDFCRGQRTTRVGEAHTPAAPAPVTDMEDAAGNDQV